MSRRESLVKRRVEEPVPRVVGRAAESEVEKVFCRRGEISPFFYADRRVSFCGMMVTEGRYDLQSE